MSVHRAQWRRMLMAALLAGATGAISYVALFPSTNVVPAADRSDQQGLYAARGNPYTTPPAPYHVPSPASPSASLPATRPGSPTTTSGPTQSSPAPSPGTSSAASPADPATSVTVPADPFPTGSATSVSVPAEYFPTPSGSTSAASTSPSSSASSTSATSSPASPGTPADGLGLGFYDGLSSPAGIEAAASWLGSSSSVEYAQDFIDATDWSHISSPWNLPNWKGSPFTMMWGVPMVPCGAPSTQCATNVADFNQVATGGADSYYVTLAQNLVAAGFGSSYIRLGWEMNADWMGWGICNSAGTGLSSWAGDFVPAFQNIVTSMRSVAGANFKFVWNPIDSSNASCPGASLENFYPGDAYVDAVALDAYDGIGATTTDSDRFSDLLNGVNAGGYTAVAPAAINGQAFQGYGLTWLAAFAKEHGKQVSLPEWGLVDSSTDGGGGDDAYFITQMAGWIKANATGPVIFWNEGPGTLTLDIPNYTNGATPNATAAFLAAFSAGI